LSNSESFLEGLGASKPPKSEIDAEETHPTPLIDGDTGNIYTNTNQSANMLNLTQEDLSVVRESMAKVVKNLVQNGEVAVDEGTLLKWLEDRCKSSYDIPQSHFMVSTSPFQQKALDESWNRKSPMSNTSPTTNPAPQLSDLVLN
jgi:hypothetical protein